MLDSDAAGSHSPGATGLFLALFLGAGSCLCDLTSSVVPTNRSPPGDDTCFGNGGDGCLGANWWSWWTARTQWWRCSPVQRPLIRLRFATLSQWCPRKIRSPSADPATVWQRTPVAWDGATTRTVE